MSESIEDIDCYTDGKKTDFVSITGSLLSSINFKMGFFLFFLGMLVFSDLFINTVLNNFTDTIHGECTTTKGSIIQLLTLTVGFLILDLMVKFQWI